MITKVNECFPEKTLKFTSDDSPWVNEKVKTLKRLKGREYNDNRSSKKFLQLNEKYKEAQIKAKQKYYKNIVKEKSDPILCSEIEHLTDQEQADKIADFF